MIAHSPECLFTSLTIPFLYPLPESLALCQIHVGDRGDSVPDFSASIPLLLGMGDLIHSPVFKCYLNTDDSHSHIFSPHLTCVAQNAKTTIHPHNKYLLITYYVRGAVLGPGSLARVRNYSDELNRMGRADFFKANCIITNYNKCTEGKECCSKNIGAYHIDWPKPHLKSKMQCVLTNRPM